MAGWLKLHRSVLDCKQFAHPFEFKIWIWLLCKASTQDRTVTLKVGNGLHVVSLSRGQLIFGRLAAERELSIDDSTIYKIIQRFVADACISITSNNRFSIITISNYSDYQDDPPGDFLELIDDRTAEKSQENNEVTTAGRVSNESGTQLNKVKKVKKVKNVKNDFSPPAAGAPKVNKKKEEAPRDHWQPFVNTWYNFYVGKHPGEAPTIVGKALRDLAKIYDFLKIRAQRKNQDWTEKYLCDAFTYFLGLAWAEDWLQKHFLLGNLVEQFDAVFARAASVKGKAPVKTFDDEIKYLLGRLADGELDDRILTPDIYNRLEEKKLIPFNYRERFQAATPDLQKAAAIRKFLEDNQTK